jgi:uncharacterized Zn finger protein (UPF0148 family)
MTNTKCPFCNSEILIIGVGGFSCPICYERFIVTEESDKLIIKIDDRFDYWPENIGRIKEIENDSD